MNGVQNQELAWRVHPARERPAAALIALLVIAAVTWSIADLMENPRWAVLPVVFFVFTLQRFFLPSGYRIDAEGVTASSPFGSQRFRWADVRRFRHDAGGAFLSTRRRPSLFDGFHGMQLLFNGNGPEVVKRIEAELERAEARNVENRNPGDDAPSSGTRPPVSGVQTGKGDPT